MSDESASSSPEPQQSSSRAGRSPVEKVIWCIIALVVLGLGLELYAKTSYENTMTSLDDAFNQVNAEPQHLSDVQKLISGLTRYGAAVQSESSSSQEEVTVKWLSPTNEYEVTLVLEKGGDDPVVAWYKMGAGNWALDPNESGGEDVPTQYGDAADPAGMTGMAGGGGAPGSHDAEGGEAPGGNPGGGSRGGGRGRPQRGLLGILGEEAVLSEISLTSEQTEKLDGLADSLRVDFGALREASPEERDAILEKSRVDTETAVKEVLDESQFVRVWQIDLQREGLGAVARPDVSAQLNLTDEQNAKLAEIVAEASAARSAAMEERNFAAFGEIREQTRQKIQELLTADQQEQWQELLGPPGPEPPQRGAFGRGPGGRGGPGGGAGGEGGSGRPQRPASDDGQDDPSESADGSTGQ